MAIGLFDLWSCLSNKLECYLISSELLSQYQILNLERLKCLGVVLDSREAKNVMEVKQLLHWFSTAGIKYVVLYDIEGVIKESIEPGIDASREQMFVQTPRVHIVAMEGWLWSVFLVLMARKPLPKQQTYYTQLPAKAAIAIQPILVDMIKWILFLQKLTWLVH